MRFNRTAKNPITVIVLLRTLVNLTGMSLEIAVSWLARHGTKERMKDYISSQMTCTQNICIHAVRCFGENCHVALPQNIDY